MTVVEDPHTVGQLDDLLRYWVVRKMVMPSSRFSRRTRPTPEPG